MKRNGLVIASVVLATIWTFAPLLAQEPPAQRQAQEQVQKANEDASAWVKAFNELTGKQRAEVVRRHINRSLATLTLTEAQRTLISDYATQFVTEENYSTTDPVKREALQLEMRPAMEKAKSVLGDDLFAAVFIRRPPISDIEAVKKDPAFR